MTLEPRRIEAFGLDLNRVRGEVIGQRGASRLDPLREKEAERELLVVPGRPHRDGDRRAVDPNLERLLDGDDVARTARLR